MTWLLHTQDEVTCFHPEFESAANEALRDLGLDGTLEWEHHLRTPGVTVIPDFVLKDRNTGKWLLVLEIKRRREDVYSSRYQFQAKSYAEANQLAFIHGSPKFFVLSNLEDTILFALNGDRPPLECRLLDGVVHSGTFGITSAVKHRTHFVADISAIILRCLAGFPIDFEVVWPAVLESFIETCNRVQALNPVPLAEPVTPNWNEVRDFFSAGSEIDSARILVFRCLMAEYLRGLLIRYGHPLANTIPPVRPAYLPSLSQAIDSLRTVDFEILFEPFSGDVYRELVAPLRNTIQAYVDSLLVPGRRVAEYVVARIDHHDLIDNVISTLYPAELQNDAGKIQTDPELAAILAAASMRRRDQAVLDPCCGDGGLLSAAYDRLIHLGSEPEQAIRAVVGIEADPLAVRLATLRLALKEPAILAPDNGICVDYGDMFSHLVRIQNTNVVLMNPPFKRYEAQGGVPVPDALRTHYHNAIRNHAACAPTTLEGQPNLFNYYVELIARTVAPETIVAIILDNKWYHNRYGKELRRLLLEHFEIQCIIEYPHSSFFENWTIATSILVAVRKLEVSDENEVSFLRAKTDPRGVDLDLINRAIWNGGDVPLDWSRQTKRQATLAAEIGWKTFFGSPLKVDFRLPEWPTLTTLFESSRRGSLEKEGGGVELYEFPFDRPKYGPKRTANPTSNSPFGTTAGAALTDVENENLRRLASLISSDFKGYALRNSDGLQAYELSIDVVTRHQTLEPPTLRANPAIFLNGRRSPWTAIHVNALDELRADANAGAFIEGIERTVGLDNTVLAEANLWNVLREPYAGELIVPRKTRGGHRVHINPFVFGNGRQLRISSNFIAYQNCRAIDPDTGLNRPMAARLVAAFLVSSFGQLQFEIEGVNREGLLSLEKEQLARIRIFDPRWIRPASREAILAAFDNVPYPVPTDRLSAAQPDRNRLDDLFAAEIEARFPNLMAIDLIPDAHAALDEWVSARQP